jgi:allantoin racemase
MAMRLFYQSFGVSRGSRDGHYGQVLKRILDQAAAHGTEISIHGLSPHRAIAEQYRYLEFLDKTDIMENGLRAEREGYDALVLGKIFDPGLHQLRELLNIPVLGLCESSVHVACLMGASFSLINVNPKFTRRIIDNITLQGLAARLVSIDRMT